GLGACPAFGSARRSPARPCRPHPQERRNVREELLHVGPAGSPSGGRAELSLITPFHRALFSEGEPTVTTCKSRWGFHPCNYETYLKLRRLHKAFWEGRRLLARWQRWSARLPKNRAGPEPAVPAVYREVCASPVVAEFHAARHGVPRPEDVRPLGLPAAQIDRWVRSLDGSA